MITGEPVPVDVSVGDEVIGATINTDGSLVVEDSTDISVAMVLAIRVTPGGRTYLHDGQTVYALTSYP